MNKPFDQRVINHLERPTSGDLNIAQSQLNLGERAFSRQLFQSQISGDINAQGVLGASFLVIKQPGTDRDVKITRGLGYQYRAFNALTDQNIDGITGLSDPLYYRIVSMEDDGVVCTVPPAPGPGLCRRDVIAVRSVIGDEGIKDYNDTDIYAPATSKFNAVSKPKTFSYDLTGQTTQVVSYSAISSLDSPVAYITGQVSPYTDPNSLLSAPLPLAAGYLNIAVINVIEAQPAVAQDAIVDYRRLVAPQGNLVVNGSATIGAVSSLPGAALSGVTLKTPPGIKALIYKADAGDTNTYALVVFGPRVISHASIAFSIGASDYYNWLDFTPLSKTNPAQIVMGPISSNQATNATLKTIAANASMSSPMQAVAIGQPYHIFPFTLCTVENVMSTQTYSVPSTTTGSITIPVNSQSNYLAGTYDVNNANTYITYSLAYPVPAAAPTAGLPSNTYALFNGALPTLDSRTVVVSPGATARFAGFVLSDESEWDSFAGGIWNLSFTQVFSDYANLVSLQARVYSYNGTTNPELGTLLFQSDFVRISNSVDILTQSVTLKMLAAAHTKAAGSRLYVALYASNESTSSADVKIWFGENRPVTLDTTIVSIPTPTVDLPNNPNPNYPSGTYSIAATTSSTVTLSIPTVAQKLNPAAVLFQTDLPESSTVPITFTANLTVEN